MGFNPNVVSSISTNFGFAPTKRTEFAVETNENDGTITSWLFVISYAINNACKDDVPEFNVKQ